MEIRDRDLRCLGCSSLFTFTAGEQEFYRSKGFVDPLRCPGCRRVRKSKVVTGWGVWHPERGLSSYISFVSAEDVCEVVLNGQPTDDHKVVRVDVKYIEPVGRKGA